MTYLWPWLYQQSINTLDTPSAGAIQDPLLDLYPDSDEGFINLPLRIETWLTGDYGPDPENDPPASGYENPLDLAVRETTGGLIDAAQETLCHPLILRRLAVLDQQGELPSALFHSFQKPSVRRCIAACVVEYTHRPVCQFVLWTVSKRYRGFVACVKSAEVAPELKQKLIEIGNKFWLGGDPIQSQVDFYAAALEGTADNPEARRRLTRAWMVLCFRSGIAALRGAIEDLRTLAAAKVLFPRLQRKLDEMGAIENPADDVYRLVPLRGDDCLFEKASLGGRIHALTHTALAQVDVYLTDEKLDPLFKRVIESEKKRAPLLADELVRHREELMDTSRYILHAGAHQAVHLMQKRIERLSALFYRQDLSRFVETGVVRLRQIVDGYLAYHKQGTSVMSLLQTLRTTSDGSSKLHPCVPASNDPEVIAEHDETYLQHYLLPAFKKLILPGSSGREILQLLFPNPGPLQGLIDEAGSTVETHIDNFLAENLRAWIKTLSNPSVINRILIDGIESAWKAEIEKARSCGNRDKLSELQSLWEAYLPKKNKKAGDLTGQAGLAIGNAVRIWVEAPYPGIHPLMQSMAKHFHATFLQSPALIKNIMYHLIDGFFYPLTDSMATASRVEEATLKLPGVVKTDVNKPGPFDDRCMDKIAGLVVYFLQNGGDYLEEDDDLSWFDKIKASAVRAALDGFTDTALGMVKSSLPGLLPVQGHLTFPGLVSLVLGRSEAFVAEDLPRMLEEHHRQLKG